MRRRLIAENPSNPHPLYVVSDLEILFVLGDPPNYDRGVEESIAARALAKGTEPLELIYDALLECNGREIIYRPMSNAEGERFESSGRNLLKHNSTKVALGDGAAHSGIICDAVYHLLGA